MCIRRSDRMLSGQPQSPHKSSQLSIRSLDTTDSTNPAWYYSFLYDNVVHAWILPPSIAQSRLGGRLTPSSACTIISITVAKEISKVDNLFDQISLNVNSDDILELPAEFLDLMANSIIEGNEIHRVHMLIRRRSILFPADTFTIPQALHSVGREMHEIDFRSYRGDAWILLPNSITHAIEHPAMADVATVTFILIMFERALLLVHNRKSNTIAIFDSHSHKKGALGAIIAAASMDQLNAFTTYVCSQLFPELMKKRKDEMVFEISCIQYLGQLKNGEMAEPVHAKVFPRPRRIASGKDLWRIWGRKKSQEEEIEREDEED